MDSHIFENIYNLYNDSLFDGVQNVISSGLTATAELLQVLGAMFIAVFGYVTMTGEMSASRGFSLILRLLVTQAALTPTYYNTYVRDVMLNWLPNWIATSVGTGTGTNAAANQFDQLRLMIVHLVAGMLAQSGGLFHLATSIEIGLLGILCELSIALTFGIWIFTRGLLALVVAVGPFIIVGNLFSTTRPFVERWLGKLGGIAILLLLVSVLLQITITQDYTFILNTQSGIGAGLGNGIEALIAIFISLVFSLLLLFYIPQLAMSLGAGAAFSPGGAVQTAARAVGAAARGVGSAGQKAASAGSSTSSSAGNTSKQSSEGSSS